VFTRAPIECMGACAVDRALVRQDGPFKRLSRADRQQLIATVVEEVLLNPSVPSRQELRQWVPLQDLDVPESEDVEGDFSAQDMSRALSVV
jgi:hypothetical protein